MQATLLRRVAATCATLVAAATLGTVAATVSTVATPAPAHASTVGGYISRSEIISRAQWWIDTYGVIYSQKQYNEKPSVTGERYRPDCSGFVSMAWRLPKVSGNDRWTGNLDAFGDTTYLSDLGQLRPGDAILGQEYGHVALFHKWYDSSKTKMWIYDEYSSTAQGRHAVMNRSWYENNDFRGLRYKKAIDGNTGVRDWDGDGRADVLARHATTGDLYLYKGNGTGGFSGSTNIGNNWSNFDVIFSAGDFDSDGDEDILARHRTSKDLYLYRGNGSGGFSGSTNIGNNWSNFDRIFSPGDFTGDGKADVIARHASTKDLYLYRGNGSGGFSGSAVNIGNNWSNFDRIFSPGDFTGDGKPDVIARHASTKDLYLYKGNGSGGFSGSAANIGNNWSNFNHIF